MIGCCYTGGWLQLKALIHCQEMSCGSDLFGTLLWQYAHVYVTMYFMSLFGRLAVGGHPTIVVRHCLIALSVTVTTDVSRPSHPLQQARVRHGRDGGRPCRHQRPDSRRLHHEGGDKPPVRRRAAPRTRGGPHVPEHPARQRPRTTGYAMADYVLFCHLSCKSSSSSPFPTRWGHRREFLISIMFCHGHPPG